MTIYILPSLYIISLEQVYSCFAEKKMNVQHCFYLHRGAKGIKLFTFRSLSDSRNISLTTSFVSAARMVCIVAFAHSV